MAVHEITAQQLTRLRMEKHSVQSQYPKACIIRFHANGSCTVFDEPKDAIGHPSAILTPPKKAYEPHRVASPMWGPK